MMITRRQFSLSVVLGLIALVAMRLFGGLSRGGAGGGSHARARHWRAADRLAG